MFTKKEQIGVRRVLAIINDVSKDIAKESVGADEKKQEELISQQAVLAKIVEEIMNQIKGNSKTRIKMEKNHKIKAELGTAAQEVGLEAAQIFKWLVDHPAKILCHKYLFRKFGFATFAISIQKIKKCIHENIQNDNVRG